MPHPGAEDRASTDHTFKENANWTGKDHIQNVYRQAGHGRRAAVLHGQPGTAARSTGTRILINASQVTNPPIDPLREPMETQGFSGQKADMAGSGADEDGSHRTETNACSSSWPCRSCSRAMSYGSISYNAHESLARAADGAGYVLQHRRGRPARGLLPVTARNTIVQVASGRFGVHKRLPERGRGHRDQDGPGRKAGHRRAPARREDRGRTCPAPA